MVKSAPKTPPLWTEEDAAQAKFEGWHLVPHNIPIKGHKFSLEVWDINRFYNQRHVWRYMKEQVLAKDTLCIKAMEYLKEYSPREYWGILR